uniref:GID complex subunit 8 homolog n=1 Tax=Tetraodon nigroviridis TaxID=99883 RepID=H3C1N2_TETNG
MMSYAEKPDDITKEEWMEKLNNVHIQRADMNRLIMNYLVTEGFKEAAEKFRMESGIEPSVDLDTLDERIKIREMILKGQIQEAIALINSLHPELLDTNRYLYFHLQQQHLIELIRLRETESALASSAALLRFSAVMDCVRSADGGRTSEDAPAGRRWSPGEIRPGLFAPLCAGLLQAACQSPQLERHFCLFHFVDFLISIFKCC